MRLISSLLAFACSVVAIGQAVPLEQYNCLSWRCIGPFRGGRTVGIDGVWSRPNELYIGVNNGGVWKTANAGMSWDNITDGKTDIVVGKTSGRRIDRLPEPRGAAVPLPQLEPGVTVA